MSEIFAGQLTAVANAVLAVFAIITAVLAGLAFRKQAREVSDQAEMLELQRRQLAEQEKTSADQAKVLKLQAEELQESLSQRKQEAARRRREQAAHVFLTEKKHPAFPNSPVIGAQLSYIAVTVTNSSTEPLYEVRLRWLMGGKAYGTPEDVRTILPGDEASRTQNFPHDADFDFCGAAAEFRDAAGVWWRRYSNGDLEELP